MTPEHFNLLVTLCLIFLSDQHSTPATQESSYTVRRSLALRPSRQDQDVRPLERQGQDPSQETLVPMHVHVLPAWTPSYGAADIRGPEGSLGREHLHPDSGW